MEAVALAPFQGYVTVIPLSKKKIKNLLHQQILHMDYR